MFLFLISIICTQTLIFLAIVSYGSLISKPENRATRLMFNDGLILLATFIGTLLSPIIMENFSRYANYGIKCGCTFLALSYSIFVLKEPLKEPQEEKTKQATSVTNMFDFLQQFVFKPIIDWVKVLFKKRPNLLHYLIFLWFYVYATYYFVMEETLLRYLYMQLTFDEFDGIDYSRYSLFENGWLVISALNTSKYLLEICNHWKRQIFWLNHCLFIRVLSKYFQHCNEINKVTLCFGSFVVMPILSKKLQIHDALLLTGAVALQGIGKYSQVSFKGQ